MSTSGAIDSSSSKSSSSSDSDEELNDFIIVQYIMQLEENFITKTPCRTSMLTGKMYTLEFLVGHEARCY